MYTDIIDLAAKLGLNLQARALEEHEAASDGCSGKLSGFYALSGRTISCHACCVAHDCLYTEGGPQARRKLADKLLRQCAAGAGKSVPGWLDKLRETNPGKALLCAWVPPARRVWRCLRAWAMYAAVRLFGGRYWG